MRLPSHPRVVVTGAGSGLGRALCLELASRKARIVVSDHNRETAEETARLVRGRGAEAIVVACDVTKVDEVEALAKAADDAFGGTDLLCNNAGIGAGGAVGEVSIADWHKTVDVDLWGVIYGCHVFVPRMRKAGGGWVLNVASAAALLLAPRMAPYNVAKAGVLALTETLEGELAGSGVGVSVLCPTFFPTNIIRDGLYSTSGMRKFGEKMMERSKLTAEDVARLCIAGVEAGDLHIVPMRDGRWLWRLKRVSPAAYRFLNRRMAMEMSKRDGATK